jgi:hypothetical protein
MTPHVAALATHRLRREHWRQASFNTRHDEPVELTAAPPMLPAERTDEAARGGIGHDRPAARSMTLTCRRSSIATPWNSPGMPPLTATIT